MNKLMLNQMPDQALEVWFARHRISQTARNELKRILAGQPAQQLTKGDSYDRK